MCRASLTVVYAHKTTLGWSTLVDALRRSGFTVTEAWPLDTETSGRLRAQNSAALASSIFLVAGKRDAASRVGNYERDVAPELGGIVRERVDTLWEMGISGADLVIACVGAGLRAFTKYARVEYGNGEEVPAERFLAEVETVVLESILGKLSKTVGAKNGQTALAGLDPATRFYVLWRYTYGAGELEARRSDHLRQRNPRRTGGTAQPDPRQTRSAGKEEEQVPAARLYRARRRKRPRPTRRRWRFRPDRRRIAPAPVAPGTQAAQDSGVPERGKAERGTNPTRRPSPRRTGIEWR